MTDCRLLTIVLIVAVVAIVFFVFGGCRMECDMKREGLDTLTDPFFADYVSHPETNPYLYKYGFPKKFVPMELIGHAAYQAPTFRGMPGDVGAPQQPCGPCE
uniref:Membrane protein n=1 Tax=Marseillevirus sp. TaxID=2809551 RepID=A0AA96ES98_9VIRU|nr:membrane protein [Marseillevirus sp.]